MGSYDHSGDASICTVNQCVGNFSAEPGYIVQCNGGTYSHAGDRLYFESATFDQAATRGSFSHWTGSDLHFWGQWEGGLVTGGISYPDRGSRTVVHWTAHRT